MLIIYNIRKIKKLDKDLYYSLFNWYKHQPYSGIRTETDFIKYCSMGKMFDLKGNVYGHEGIVMKKFRVKYGGK